MLHNKKLAKMETNQKLAYKGFDKNLQCRGVQFEIGGIYEIENPKEKPKVCSSDGYHYCNKVVSCYNYYSLDGENRFCEIEVLGSFTDDYEKSITTKFRIIREITFDLLKEKRHKLLYLDLVKNIQKKHPLSSIGGSVALFLHGINLKRFTKSSISDLDIIMPYYMPIYISDEDGEEEPLEEVDAKSSGNDFDACFIYDDRVKVEVKVCPKQRYEIIEYDGFKYKVAPLEIIMAAKWRYAMNGQIKHKDDCYEISGKKKN